MLFLCFIYSVWRWTRISTFEHLDFHGFHVLRHLMTCHLSIFCIIMSPLFHMRLPLLALLFKIWESLLAFPYTTFLCPFVIQHSRWTKLCLSPVSWTGWGPTAILLLWSLSHRASLIVWFSCPPHICPSWPEGKQYAEFLLFFGTRPCLNIILTEMCILYVQLPGVINVLLIKVHIFHVLAFSCLCIVFLVDDSVILIVNR
jgi:hypothetical protein